MERLKENFKRHIVTLILCGVCAIIGLIIPVQERDFSMTDLSISFPYRENTWSIPVLTISFTGAAILYIVFMKFFFKSKKPWVIDFIFSFALSQLYCVTFVGVLKPLAGRLRPDFLARCIPEAIEGGTDVFKPAKCTTQNLKLLKDGRQSFPSGHSASAFASFGFLALFNYFELKGYKSSLKTFSSLVSFFIASWIAVSRRVDNRHHMTDVLFGSIIGLSCSFLSYLHFRYSDREEKNADPSKIEAIFFNE
eukprot:TRINITY_DN6953_c0_g1_i1.p1 TRINITY_DN6953_c0_g1~~TRINITY_DN6953_c0_g1_i1.p1  ORF type:complete len:251 (+),score=55.75 TRINITY_DN6953_c0_g1_i1:27-779(+)